MPPSDLLSQLAAEAAPTIKLPRAETTVAPVSGGVPPPYANPVYPPPGQNFQDPVAAPPPPPPAIVPIGPPPIGPQKEFSNNDRNAPMRGMAPIPKHTNMPDAQHMRLSWRGPTIYGGEPVFFRKHRENDECIAWVLGKSNQTYTLTVLPGNSTAGNKNSVAYYDPFGPPHENDPMGPHNSAGTFRRTEFGRMISQMLAPQPQAAPSLTLEQVYAMVQPVMDRMRLEIEDMKRERDATQTAIQIADELSGSRPATAAEMAEAKAVTGSNRAGMTPSATVEVAAATEQPKAVEAKPSTEPKNGNKAKGN